MDVLLIDDHPLIHDTVRAIVRSVCASAEVHSQSDLGGGLFEARLLSDLDVVIFSADEDAEHVNAALAGGAVGYLPKTLRPKAMADALRVVLDKRAISVPRLNGSGAVCG